MRNTLAAVALSLIALTVAPATLASAQSALVHNRVTALSASRSALADSINPRAKRATDLGVAPSGTVLTGVTLRFSPTTAQNAALDTLLAAQQNTASPLYHQWLTPESYADSFGLSAADVASVTSWLQAQGLTVTAVSRSRTFVTVTGTAGQLAHAFGATLHTLQSADGAKHIGNLTQPTVPTAFASVVGSITGLSDFHLRPRARVVHPAAVNPQFTSSVSGKTYIAPGDFYTIYDVSPLLNSSINGSGITIAVMGQTDISLTDVAAFRSASGLTTNNPTVKLYGQDPGTSTNDIDEAQLDVEWSGAVAPSATILYVNSTDVIGGSLTQAIDNNLAPIITVSYGDCESAFGNANIATYSQLFRQANSQGQTIVGPAGDSGATDCDYDATTATQGLAVDFPASSPNVTGMGGSMFNENGGTYFGTTNNSNAGSALSYIPEAVWNETAAEGELAAGGGGVSNYFAKPSWQTGTGVPADGSRNVPDVALDAAVVHDGFLICSRGLCVNGFRYTDQSLDVIGGTSVAVPSFGGIMALLQQKIQSRVGNANPTLYALANSSYYSTVFHDITVGNNDSPCTAGTPNCPSGGSIGYAATTGYDLASGWGSLDATNLVNDWLLVTPTTSTTGATASTTTVTPSVTSVNAGTAITLTVTVASASSSVTTTPTGTVQLLIDNTASGSAVTLSAGSATLTASTTGLASGNHIFAAAYSGDTTFAGSKGGTTVDVISTTSADFAISPTTATATAVSGKSANGITFTVTPAGGFTGSVTFSATTTSTTVSDTASYTFSVNPVVIGSTAAGSTVFTLSAYTSSAAGSGLTAFARKAVLGARALPPPQFIPEVHATPGATHPLPAGALPASGLALAGLTLLCIPAGRRRLTRAQLRSAGLFVALLALTVSLTLTGCGGGTATATGITLTTTSAGTYTVTVTATATSGTTTLTHNANVTFVVQ